MKTKNIIYHMLMFLPLLIVCIALPFLPEQIPAHYGFDGQVTRWGSKYEALLYPIVTILMGYFLRFMANLAAKQEEHGENNRNVILMTGIAILGYFNVMNLYALYTDFNGVEDLSSVSLDLWQLLFGVLGFVMVVLGNIMPKLRYNSIAGLRTKWSMKNELTWKKSQRFGGISFMIGGSLVIAVCFLTKGAACFFWTMGILALLAVVDVCYTIRIAGKHK